MPGSLVAPVVGAVAGKVLGGGKASATGTQTQNSTSQVMIPDFLQPAADKFGSLASSYANSSYTPYTGQRFADFNQDQLNAFDSVRGLQGQAQGVYGDAIGMNNEAAQIGRQGLTGEQIQGFMNPYQQNVIDIGKRETLRDFQGQLNGIGDMAANVGAFGGDRMGVLESNAYRDLMQNLSDQQNTGMQQSYNQAVNTGLANNQQMSSTLGNAASNLGQLGAQGMNTQLQGIGALQGIGGQQQAQAQLPLDFNYQQFREQQNFAPQQLSTLAGAFSPFLGQSSSSTGAQFGPQQSSLQGMLGGAAIGQSVFGNMFSNLGVKNTFGMNNTINPGAFSLAGQGSLFSKGGLVKYASGGEVYGANSKGNSWSNPFAFTQTPDERFGPNKPSIFEQIFSLKDQVEPYKNAPSMYDNWKKDRAIDKGDTLRLRDAVKDTTERHLIENKFLAQERPEEFGHLIMTPEEKSKKALQDKIANIGRELGIKSFSTAPAEEGPVGPPEETPKESAEAIATAQGSPTGSPQAPESPLDSFFKTVDIPMLALGAKILGSKAGSDMGAVGEGVEAYIGAKAAQASAAQEGKQQQFDNMLKLMTAESYKQQNELAARKATFEEEMFPLKKQQLEAEIAKLRSEAGDDPIKKQAAEDVAKMTVDNPNAYSTAQIPQLVANRENQLRAIAAAQGLGGGGTQISTDPLGLFAQ